MEAWGKLALIGAILAFIALPSANANHCETHIHVYGRGWLTPGIVPPPTQADDVCLDLLRSSASPTHSLLPDTTQIVVRVEMDPGSAYPTLLLKLTGLGWQSNPYSLHREELASGMVVYTMDEWLSIPDPQTPGGELRATVRIPQSAEFTTTYRLLSLPSV